MANEIQIAVARLDLWLCQIAAWPWKRIALSVAAAWIVVHVVRAARHERGGVG